jgi:GNAT superfamily N-acetyltransferase
MMHLNENGAQGKRPEKLILEEALVNRFYRPSPVQKTGGRCWLDVTVASNTGSYNGNMAIVIREARPDDTSLILALVRELAEFEREPDAVKIGEVELLRDGFPVSGGVPYYDCLIAEEDGAAAGMALFFPVYSTWRGRSLHLEDLIVRPPFRGRGIGKALLTKVAAVAVERGCAKLFWHVLDWNAPAIEFYKSLGATAMDEWTRMQLVDGALESVAAMSDAAQ